jgi:hypothetical protein
MYVIERVTGLIFKKDGDHLPYQLKQWKHSKTTEAVKALLETVTPAAHSHEAGPSSEARRDKGGKKIRNMLRDLFGFCKYNATQTYELRKDINKLLLKVELPESYLVPPPTFPFFPDSTSSEEEQPESAPVDTPYDDEPLSVRLTRAKAQDKARGKPPKIAIRKTLKTPSKPPESSSATTYGSDSDESDEVDEYWSVE